MTLLFVFSQLMLAKAPSEVVGRYTNGCLKNADRLERNFPGFQVVRLSRDRFYVHSSLKAYLKELGKKMVENGTTFLIADTSKKQGGPDRPWHNSHQVGLDADVLLQRHPVAQERSLSYQEREAVTFRSLLTPDKKYIVPRMWGTHVVPAIKAAATTAGVQRIFVNPIIKKQLCDEVGDKEWLGKVRPWFHHDAHMHIRLYCPQDSPDCVSQAEPPSGSGCGKELDDWVDEIRNGKAAVSRTHDHEHDSGGQALARPKRCRN